MKKMNSVLITFLLLFSLVAGFMFAGRIGNKGDTSSSSATQEEDTAFSFSSVKSKLTGSDSTKETGSSNNTESNKEVSASQSSSSDNTSTASAKKANPITKAIVSETIDTIAEQKGGAAKEIAESMSPEDKAAVTEIIAANVSLSDLPKVQSYVTNSDSASLIAYAEENFSAEDVSKLKSIMSKYQSQ